jgi:hypothetical protein
MSQITVRGNLPFNGTNLQDSSPFERRQNTFRQLHNREVREVFADVFDPSDVPDGTPYDPTKVTPLSSPRRVMRQDVLIEDGDSFSEMWLKRELLKFMKDDDMPVLLPNYDEVSITAKDKPHVHLLFMEKKSTATINRRRRVEALITFRIPDKTATTITRADLNELTREINLAFPSSYRLEKGRIKYSYRDKENGYSLVLSLRNETEAREVVTKVLAIRDKTPDWENLYTSTREKNFDTTETIFVLGELERLPKQRPLATCFLKSAWLTIGKLRKYPLVSRVV